MNSPNPKTPTKPSLFSIVMVLTLLCSSIFVMLPVLQAADVTPGEGVQFAADNHASHEHAATQDAAGPVVIDFGGAEGAPIAGLEQWQQGELVQSAALDADVLGPKRVMVLRVYFNDYANASRYTNAQVEGFFGQLDQLWRNTSYNKINIESRVSELYKLPKNRSSYVNDYASGDLSESKFYDVIADAVDNAPAGLDWSNIDAVMVVMAETDPAQFHRGEAIKCNAKMGPGGATKFVGCAIFSENPSDTDINVWGRWAHEIGHAFQDGGPAHPSNYNNEFELMDSNYPGQTGAFEKQSHTGFPGWLPPAKYLEVTAGPNSSGETVCLRAIEYDPAGQPTQQAFKVKITNSLYYLVSVRRKVLGDDLNGQFNGIPDEGVLIERVNEGADPWVTVKGPGGDRNKLWKEGQTYEDAGDGVFLSVVKKASDDEYCVTLRFTKGANQPDVALYPWLSSPGNTWETTDIWVDSPVNGYGTYRYGSWNDLSGNAVPRGNGDDPAVGLTNRLYARVRNWGSIAATDVVVNWEVTDPLGVGIAGASGWAAIGTVDKNTFPGLAAIAPGAFVDVYVDWTPNVTLTPEQMAAGVFAFHTCVRVKINPVAGETALANQNGDREQENISYFEATTAGGGAPVYKDVIRLRNDDKVNKKFFHLSYKSDLPAAWSLDINGGVMGLELGPDELREIPVIIKPQGPAVVGSIFGVDVAAASRRDLVSDLDPKDLHLEFDPLGGVRVEARVLEPTKINCSAEDLGEIVVKGTLASENFAKFYDEKNPPRVLVQGIDEKGNAIQGGIAANVAGVQPDGSFNATIYSRQPDIKAVLCLFAGTDKLASSSSGYQPVPNPNDPKACGELVSPTQIPSAGLIHFDDLSDATVIGNHYAASYGVNFEDSPTNRAISYDQSLHPTESTLPHSRPSYAINSAVSPNTSEGVPMVIKFAEAKTHVGFYMGNGLPVGAAALAGLMTAYDSAGAVICQVSNSPVPDSVKEFIGVHDPAGRITSVTLDYGKTLSSETIDDLFFAPYTAVSTPTATPTATNTPATPTNTPTPTPTNTPVVATNPIVAAPYLPVQKFAIESILTQKDLAIHGIEITQGVQCFDTSKGLAGCADNSLPVIAKKDATARIYLKYSSPIFIAGSLNNVPVRLHIFANGVEYIANASGKATTTINQGNSDSADVYFNVNFSNDVNVSFYAEVDPNGTIVETNEGNNRYPASGTINLTFRKSKTLDIVGTRLRYHPSGYAGQQYAGGWAVNGGAADWLEQVLPLRNNGIDYSLSSGYLNWTGSLGGGDGQHDLIRYLNTSYILQNAFGWLFGNGPYIGAEHLYGWAPNAGYSGGHADMPVYPHAGGLGKAGIGTDRTADGANSTDDAGGGALIFGHELVHDYDVLHTDTADACGSSDDNSDFPYGSSSIQEYGFNPITGKIYDPATTHDLMSYCPAGGSKDGWIAPFTWSRMAGKLDAAIVAAAATYGPQTAINGFLTSAAAQSLVVNATVYNPAMAGFDPAKPGKLGDLYLVDTGVEYPVAVGNYAIQLRKGEEVLATKSFSISFESEYSAHGGGAADGPPGDPADLKQADISFILPWVDGTTTVALVQDGQVLDTRQISANKPTVTVTSPNADVEWPTGSIQTLTWQGSDADGDTLRYSVFFSVDGGVSWDLMATELVTPSLEIEVDAMAGTTGGKFRIVATDGVNIGQGDSATVKIPNKAPTAAISDPVNGKLFIPGQLVVLQGAALDLEDGRLGDEMLNWASDKQGALGSGPSLPVNNLQPGEHVITLSVVDSQGAPASATAKILVGYQVYLPTISK